MKFRSLHNWELSEEVEGLIYFAQRMDELLFDFTLDSFKPPALNPASLCQEAISFIEDVEDGEVDVSGLGVILDELTVTISNDVISKRLLELPLDQYVLDQDEISIDRKKLRLEVLQRTLEPELYFHKTQEFLVTAIEENRKSDIGDAAKILVSLLIGQGMSKAYLYQKTQEFFFYGSAGSEKISSPQDIERYLELISPIGHQFDVFFLVSDELLIVEDSLEAFRIEVIQELPKELSDYATKNAFAPEENEVIVQIGGIHELDCYSARQAAERKIDMLRDLFTLYFHRTEIAWRDDTLISQCCVDAPRIVSTPKSPMQKAFDSTPAYASKRLNFLLSNLSLQLDRGQSFRKFNRIVDLHGISVTNEVPENQLLNLWISMETLVPTGKQGRSTIGRVVTSLEPFVRCTYVSRLVGRAYKDLTLWSSFATRKVLRRVDGAQGKKGPVKLLGLLCIRTEANEALRAELYRELKDFHLLRNRLYRLEQALQTSEKILRTIDDHAKRVGWQIRRLYRTRNMLVHTGRTPKYLEALIENGHDYLDLVLDTVVALSCGPNNISSLEQAFELQKMRMIKLNRSLKATENLGWSELEVLLDPEWSLKYTGQS